MTNPFALSPFLGSVSASAARLGAFWLAAAASAQNLATNPGFETGTTSGWYGFGSPMIAVETSVVHSGNYAAFVSDRTATYMGIAQSFTGVLQIGVTYNISAWVQLAGGSRQTMQLTIKQVDGAGTGYYFVASGTVATNGWTQLSGQFTFTYSGTLTSLDLYVEMPSSATNSYYMDDVSVTPPAVAQTNGACVMDWTNVFQRIDGFGASSAWNSGITPSLADMFFSTNTGIGLSLLRSRIAPDGTTVESSAMQLAQARGARVWSTPWSPPAALKDANANGVLSVNGGPLAGNPANYQAYASQLAGYVANMKRTYAVNIYAVSVQNEPDTDTTNYESCTWTAQQFHDFIPYLASALAASNVATTKILFPESYTWAGHLYFQQTAMTDPAVAPLVGIVADHNYDGVNFNTGDINPPAAINNYGKALWETEVSTGDAYNGSITNALYWAGRIHQFMTVAQANAWHYWWLTPTGPDNQALTDTSQNPAKRMYALGNFSRFVRPNFYRIGVDTNSGPLQISAYKEPRSGHFAIVVINPSAAAVTQVFNLAGFTAASLTPWITSATQSLASLPAIAVAGHSFTNTIPALSVVTFAGVSTTGNLPPVLAPVADASLGADQTLTLTNSATDPNLPPPALTFSLLSGPTNATLNSSNGVFVWTPLASQANSTNLVSVVVSDNGTPALTATNHFHVTVLPLARPVIISINPSGSHWVFTATGALGPNYTLSTSTNLSAWQPLFTTNPSAMPLTLTATNDLQPQRFYRLQVGP